jgi:hypothetical protein
LVDLLKATLDHHRGEHFTPDTAGAIGDHGLILEVVIFSALDFPHKIMRGASVRDNGVLESADVRFPLVATVKEGDRLSLD